MLFNSPEFLMFLPLVFAGYWLLGSHLRLQNLFVVVASYVFYGWWDWRFLALIAFTSAWSWAFGLMEANAAPRSAGSKARLALSCVINLGILGVFKSYDFFLGQAGELLRACGFEPHVAFLQVALPVGVSFYTFQALSYTIDVYRSSPSSGSFRSSWRVRSSAPRTSCRSSSVRARSTTARPCSAAGRCSGASSRSAWWRTTARLPRTSF